MTRDNEGTLNSEKKRRENKNENKLNNMALSKITLPDGGVVVYGIYISAAFFDKRGVLCVCDRSTA